MTPRWRRHLEGLVERERPDAVVVFTVPMAHLRGIPTALRERFGVPVVFYDGDAPMSLPEFGGMDTGFNWYHGADPSEYDLRGLELRGRAARLLELGARRAEAVFWAADPEFFAPQPVEKEIDVFFYGYGDKFRREWMQAIVGEPSRRLPEVDFALGGRDFRATSGRARIIGDVPFNAFSRAISAARINLCITRRSHATVFASSTCRPFELASAAPRSSRTRYEGIERWFEPGRSCSSSRRRRGGGRVSRAARRSGAGRGARPPRPRARARRAHLRAPGPAGARACRASRVGGARGVTGAAPHRDRPRVQRGGVDRRGSSTRSARSTRASTSS